VVLASSQRGSVAASDWGGGGPRGSHGSVAVAGVAMREQWSQEVCCARSDWGGITALRSVPLRGYGSTRSRVPLRSLQNETTHHQ